MKADKAKRLLRSIGNSVLLSLSSFAHVARCRTSSALDEMR